jgi:hypothetical protein
VAALRRNLHSWQLSSSCCVLDVDKKPLSRGVAPALLGAHIRFWLDGYLDEAGRRLFLMRLNESAKVRMVAMGITPAEGAAVDPATGIFNQPIFLRASFEGGLEDPLPVRSGLNLTGRPAVRLSVLDSELPALPEKAADKSRTRPEPTEEQRREQEAYKARKLHSARLYAAQRQREGKVLRPLVHRPCEVTGATYRQTTTYGKRERFRHVSRWNKLADVIKIVHHRMETDPAWSSGVPTGSRRLTMKCMAGLLSHFVPASRLEETVRGYAIEFCGSEWTYAEWDKLDRIGEYMKKAWAAEAAEARGLDGTSIRETPFIKRIAVLLDIHEQEQISLELKAIRTDAVRKKLERKRAGGKFREERDAEIAKTSAEANKPWLAQGISRRTYYNRQAVAKKAAEAISKATVTTTETVISAPAPVIPAQRVARPSLGRLFPGFMVRPAAMKERFDPATGEMLLKPLAHAEAA